MAGPRQAVGTGRFTRVKGSGKWNGTGPSGVCSGVWTAVRAYFAAASHFMWAFSHSAFVLGGAAKVGVMKLTATPSATSTVRSFFDGGISQESGSYLLGSSHRICLKQTVGSEAKWR